MHRRAGSELFGAIDSAHPTHAALLFWTLAAPRRPDIRSSYRPSDAVSRAKQSGAQHALRETAARLHLHTGESTANAALPRSRPDQAVGAFFFRVVAARRRTGRGRVGASSCRARINSAACPSVRDAGSPKSFGSEAFVLPSVT